MRAFASVLAISLLSLQSVSAGKLDDLINSLKPTLNPEKFVNDFKTTPLQLHAKALQKFADDNGGTRSFGSKGYNASVAYVYTAAKLAGYDVVKQSLPNLFSKALNQTLVVGSTPINVTGMTYSPSTPEDGITTSIVLVPDAEAAPSPGCTVGDYAGVDVSGKIALIQRGSCTFAAKSIAAKQAGAVAAIVYNNVDGELNGTLGEENDAGYVPTAGISKASGEIIIQQIQTDPTAFLNLVFFREIRWSENVIATSKAGNQSNIIFVGGHLDSVEAGPGINDDGSGTISVLEIALKLAKYKLTNAVRFAWWTAEEVGLVGSTHYVDSLSDEEKSKIALYINLDMVASPNYVYGIYDGKNATGSNTADPPPGSAAIEDVLQAYFTKASLPTVPSTFNGRSDYGPFIEAGIPSGGLFTGAEGIKTEAEAQSFGGQAGVAYDVNYHQAGDTYNNLNFTAFLTNVKAAAYAFATFVKSTAAVDAQKKGLSINSKLDLSVAPSVTSPAGSVLTLGSACGHEAVAA